MPRTAGRRSSTCIAVSSPVRIAAIIPLADHANTIRLANPMALVGVAIATIASSTCCAPSGDTGSASTT